MKDERPGLAFYLEVALVGALILYGYASALIGLWNWIVGD